MAQEKKATVIATGKKVTVYKSSQRDEWIEFPNCTVSHKPKDLKFTK